MGFFSLSRWLRRWRKDVAHDQIPERKHVDLDRRRRCQFETMEDRRMMTAAPLAFGATFLETDTGSDVQADLFEVQFTGGAAGTQLNQLVINGNQGGPTTASGYNVGDVLFDTVQGGFGADLAWPFAVVSQTGNGTVSANVADGGMVLTLNFTNFEAGDKLVFSIDVDHVNILDPTATTPAQINPGIDPIVSGLEFQGTHLTASFSAPNYQSITDNTTYQNMYDNQFAGTNLLITDSNPNGLPYDDYNGQRDRSDGTAMIMQQKAIPATISGYVYSDPNNNGIREPGEKGIAGVPVEIIPINTVEAQNPVTVITDANGFYQSGNLMPGTYRIVELTQPAGYFDGLDRAGTINGVTVGAATNPGDDIENITLNGGNAGVEYDFGELGPASLSGDVRVDDSNGNPNGPQSKPLPGATISLYDSTGTFVTQTTTDANGNYDFTNLHPGTFKVVETPPTGYIHDSQVVGSAGGVASPFTLSNIQLAGFQNATDYDFSERLPATLSGFVYHDKNDNGQLDAGEPPIAGVTVILDDSQGNQVATQVTNASGFYQFTGLNAGTYSVVEVQPAGWLEGLDSAGTVSNVTVGQAVNPGEMIQQVALKYGDNGVNYDFGHLLPGSFEGFVHTDPNLDCVYDAGDAPISGVTLQLLNSQGNVIGTTQTDANGHYKFDNLYPGTYGVRELPPAGYFHEGQMAGTGGGVATNELISQINVGSDQHFVDYDFCEIPPSSISGSVNSNPRGSCMVDGVMDDSGETPIAGVVMHLLDSTGTVIATTQTDVNGDYTFGNLMPGDYTVTEEQPAGYFNGDQNPGSVGGDGSVANVISQINLGAGITATDYDFCELPPSSISGSVNSNPRGTCMDDGVMDDSGETPIAGVVMHLLDSNGNVIATTQTDVNGDYTFSDLPLGTYTVTEEQPAGYFNGDQNPGSVGGDGSVDNVISQIVLNQAVNATDYDFCELPPSSISGAVNANPNGTCMVNGVMDDSGETPIAGVVMHLVDSNGNVIATTQTDVNGDYKFSNLTLGTYTVTEEQPAGYYNGDQNPGSIGGDGSVDNVISQIVFSQAVDATDYDFCEAPPSQVSGYVFQDGPAIATPDGQPPADLLSIRDGIRRPGDAPIAGVVLELREGVSGAIITGDEELPGLYGPGPIQAVTDANGFYQFVGLQGGLSYAVFEVKPADYIDGINTPGTTSGIAFSEAVIAPAFVIESLAFEPTADAIVRIPVGIGVSSQDNNFSVVKVVTEPPQTPPPPNPPAQTPYYFNPAATPFVAAPNTLAPILRLVTTPDPLPTFGGRAVDVTWHLSILDAGNPRGEGIAPDANSVAYSNVSLLLGKSDWTAQQLRAGKWTVMAGKNLQNGEVDADGLTHEFLFGVKGGTPISGDFNGDGLTEMGIYYNGEWFIDLNGNGVWDSEDLWAKLGTEHDRPVVGDWNGDGKDDIGIFGPQWNGDPRAIACEPGLPDLSNNAPKDKPKNLPPNREEATDGHRLLKLTQRGKPRADLIDHVFRYGKKGDTPVTGDWQGDGIDTIGIFRDGEWLLDMDGDGTVHRDGTGGDVVAHYGQVGDIPVVGDFDGDGVDEIGVFRDGTWYVDTNHNRELDAHDKVFQMGGHGDKPVVGDWDGDGVDEPGIYREGEPPAETPVNK